jgi:hypothetical protein
MNTDKKQQKDYSLNGFLNKINKTDNNTYGNYFVDYSDILTEVDYQGYITIIQLYEEECFAL